MTDNNSNYYGPAAASTTASSEQRGSVRTSSNPQHGRREHDRGGPRSSSRRGYATVQQQQQQSSSRRTNKTGGGNSQRQREPNYYGDDGGQYNDSYRSYSGRGYPPRRQNYEDYNDSKEYKAEDWKCLECSTWNYPNDDRCVRCNSAAVGAAASSWKYGEDEEHENKSRKRPAEAKDAEEEEVDEFGRAIATKPKTDTKTRWPPSFESNGSAFVLDQRSGMFYEALSDFFYDPQSKLYYGNKQQTYYNYDKDTKRYVVVLEQGAKSGDPEQAETTENQQVAQGSTSLTNNNKTAAANAAAAAAPTKNKISINLKTKSLDPPKKKKKTESVKKLMTTDKKKETNTSSSSATSGSMIRHKQHERDLEKWSNISQQQQRRTDADDHPKQPSSGNKIATTAKGEPICLLCRRKFPTLEKLEYHERVSELHKTNLAKQEKQQEEQKVKQNASAAHQKAQYVDRAQQRRNLYGTESSTTTLAPSTSTTSNVPLSSVVSLADSSTTNTQEALSPSSTLGSTNIGNQMLQKLGWKPEDDSSSFSVSGIRQDWQRIEALAAASADSSSGRPSKEHRRGGGAASNNGGIGSQQQQQQHHSA